MLPNEHRAVGNEHRAVGNEDLPMSGDLQATTAAVNEESRAAGSNKPMVPTAAARPRHIGQPLDLGATAQRARVDAAFRRKLRSMGSGQRAATDGLR